jgi:large subunit ribosomal protein L29
MKMKEVREMTTEELVKAVADMQQEQLNLQIQSKTGQLENPTKIRQIRRDIARIKTEITARA